MKPEAQRIAIAEACGWSGIRTSSNPDIGDMIGMYGPLRGFSLVPNYLSDLNAMNEAEKVLANEKQCEQFAVALAVIMKCFPSGPYLGPQSYLWHASADQRAEALLRTLNLWTE